MNNVKFIRAEYLGSNYHYPMKYFWECSECGAEYITKTPNTTNGLCDECEKKEYQRRTRERQEKAEQKIRKKIITQMKRGIFPLPSDIPTIILNGVKYYQADAFDNAIRNFLDEGDKG